MKPDEIRSAALTAATAAVVVADPNKLFNGPVRDFVLSHAKTYELYILTGKAS